MKGLEESYSSVDRIVHRLAFANRSMQMTAMDIESTLFSKRFKHIAVDQPVFVTSLPRAGTTLLLEVLSRLPGFVSHCYRDMPLVLAPLLWELFSERFRKPGDLRERAHGDGMAVSYDSPEAFEEVLWRFSWPDKFGDDHIALWSPTEETGDFRRFFTEHIQKLIASRPGSESPARYVSKNNANIARLPFLRKLYPEGIVLVPFRHPLDQAESLLGQHRRFLDVHAREAFSRKYMEDIGHLEFGALHRPIRFDGIDQVSDRYSTETLDYWLAYWVIAFTHIWRFRDQITLVSYENCCEDFRSVAAAMARYLHVDRDDLLDAAGDRFRRPNRYSNEAEVRDRDLLEGACRLHDQLLEASIA